MVAKKEEGFLDLKDLDPDFIIDVPYARKDNFTGTKVYNAEQIYLRESVAHRLVKVHENLKSKGFLLKLFDGYRPFYVQEKFWKTFPNSNYVAPPKRDDGNNPERGSSHNRGAAVDLTMTDKSGKEVKMPSEFDDFSEKAHRDKQNMGNQERKNLEILEEEMAKQGFEGLPTEWWHYESYDSEEYPLSDKKVGNL